MKIKRLQRYETIGDHVITATPWVGWTSWDIGLLTGDKGYPPTMAIRVQKLSRKTRFHESNS